MSYYNQDEGVCFDFSITLTPKSAGDYGSIRMGGMSRSIKECLSQANEICDQINRHVDGVDSLEITVTDESGRFEDLSEWEAKQILGSGWNLKWEDYKDKLPLAKTSYKDKYNVLSKDVHTLIDNPLFKEHLGNTANYLREQLEEWENE